MKILLLLALLIEFLCLIDGYKSRFVNPIRDIGSPLQKVRSHKHLNPLRVKSDLVDEAIVKVDYTGDLYKTAVWFAGSAAFCGVVSQVKGVDSAIEFASGYFLEQALSIDNLFVFIILFGYFKIPKEYEEKILGYGILGGSLILY